MMEARAIFAICILCRIRQRARKHEREITIITIFNSLQLPYFYECVKNCSVIQQQKCKHIFSTPSHLVIKLSLLFPHKRDTTFSLPTLSYVLEDSFFIVVTLSICHVSSRQPINLFISLVITILI